MEYIVKNNIIYFRAIKCNKNVISVTSLLDPKIDSRNFSPRGWSTGQYLMESRRCVRSDNVKKCNPFLNNSLFDLRTFTSGKAINSAVRMDRAEPGRKSLRPDISTPFLNSDRSCTTSNGSFADFDGKCTLYIYVQCRQ